MEMGVVSVCPFIYERTILCSQDHSGASLVSAIRNPDGPLVEGSFNTNLCIFQSMLRSVSFIERLDACGRDV